MSLLYWVCALGLGFPIYLPEIADNPTIETKMTTSSLFLRQPQPFRKRYRVMAENVTAKQLTMS